MNIKNENHRKAFIHGDGDGEADNAAKKEASQFKKPETKNTSASPKASALKKVRLAKGEELLNNFLGNHDISRYRKLHFSLNSLSCDPVHMMNPRHVQPIK